MITSSLPPVPRSGVGDHRAPRDRDVVELHEEVIGRRAVTRESAIPPDLHTSVKGRLHVRYYRHSHEESSAFENGAFLFVVTISEDLLTRAAR